MKFRTAGVRAGVACLLMMVICRVAVGSTTILRIASKISPELAPVQTYAGKSEPVIANIKPAAPVTVVLLTDSLSPAEMETIKKELVALYLSLHGHPFRLAVLGSGAIGFAGPFASRALLKSALSEIAGKTDSPAPADSALDAVSAAPARSLRILDNLCGSVGRLGGDWSRVLLIGELPPLETPEREYASALLLRAFGNAHLQVSWYAFSGGDDGWQPLFQATGGNVIRGALSDFSHAVDDMSQSYFQVDWTPPALSSGFVVARSVLSDLHGNVVLEAPDVAVPAGVTLPSIELYASMRAKGNEATQLLAQETLNETAVQTIRDDLAAALEINPRDPGLLLTAAAFHEKLKDYAAAARERAALTEVRPLDAASFASLGHTFVLGSDFDAAEAPLRRAIALNLRTPQMAEDFARIRLAHKDDKGALPYLEEALNADPKRQDLWFDQARAADRRKDSSLAIRSFEEALALGGVHSVEGASLARLYLATNQNAKASQLVRQIVAALPPELDVRAQFAESIDELQLKTEALSAWKRVLEAQADSGPAHLRISQLLLESGDTSAAEQAANVGLAILPKLAPLYIVKADALEKSGRAYEARKALEEGAANVRDVALLSRLAAAEDSYQGLAADAYSQLAEALEPTSPERLEAIKRGFAVSVRDADQKHVQSFAALLDSPAIQPRGPSGKQEQMDSRSLIPGGLEALAFSAHGKEGVPPDKFLVEYCRTLINRVPEEPTPNSKLYVGEIQEHFQRIAALEALGKRDGSRVVLTLSLNDKEARRRTEKVLALMGMKLRVSNGVVELDRGEKKGQAKKQETASALAVDEVGLLEALKAGKAYDFEITDEWVPVYPNEKLWREAFYSSGGDTGGIATAMLRLPKMARLYVGISHLDRKAASELVSAMNLNTLAQRYADLVYNYAAAFAVLGGHAVVPGGRKAEAIWASLAGASPAQPAAFFSALLQQNNGKLLAFFFALSQLERQHQEFFTLNPSRTSQFYKFFAESERARHGISAFGYDSAFAQFLRSVPLDSQGHVDFPGSPEVWTVAKGRSSSGTQVAKMMKKVSKAAAPEVEDELLLHLAQTRYKENAFHHTEMENFLAVARIDVHRLKPLDEPSALLLAQNYSDFSTAYAYLTEITGLDYSDYLQFFAALERMRTHTLVDTNLQLGQFHALIEWICLLRNRHAINDGEAARLFKYVCDQFYAADAPPSYTIASLESARAILKHCKTGENNASADDKIRGCLLGFNAKPDSRRTLEFQRALASQKVPALESILAIYDGLTGIKSQGGAAIDPVKKAVEGFPAVELPKSAKAEGKERESITRYDPSPAQKLVAELTQKLSKKKSNSKDIEKVSQELLGELQPQITLALAGQLYAYFLRPSDLVVSEDPLLLRKHHYFKFDSETERKQLLVESTFNQSSQGIGSYFVGGFAQFALATGKAASVGWKTAGPGGSASIAVQVAAIRSAAWDRLEESDQRLASLRITVAREWIYMSADQDEAFRALSEDTMGVLSLSRRADLLNGIKEGNWREVWESVTLPDLFLLGGKYVERFKTDLWNSPLTASLRSVAAANDGSRLNILGSIPYHSFGCNHPHLVPDAPYEEYESQMFPDELAERSADFKLFLAFQADSLGVQPSDLADVAETLASKAFRNIQMMDSKDWRSLLAGFASIKPKDIKQALEQGAR